MNSGLCGALALLAAAATMAGPAVAGPYADDLGKCLVRSATPADQTQLMRWMFTSLALHPDIKTLADIDEATRADVEEKAAALFGRLIFTDCRADVVAALKYEGFTAYEQSFSLLGQIAARGLFTSPEVSAGLARLGTESNKEQFKALAKEAGLPSE